MSSPYDISTGTSPRPSPTPTAADPTSLRRAGTLCAVGGLIAVVGTAWGFSRPSRRPAR